MSNTEVDRLLAILPLDIQKQLVSNYDTDKLLEIVMDLERVPEARFTDQTVDLQSEPLTMFDLAQISNKFVFADNNRAGIPNTLHRISCMRNRAGVVVGLTMRVGKPIPGCAQIIRELLETGKSILVLGAPGLGKTSILRDAAYILSSDMRKRTVVVDTSSEIAGDSDAPHAAIGRARRMHVPMVSMQAKVMTETVANHMPEVILIDEITNLPDVQAARTIAERGVQLIATAHGKTLQNIIDNPMLSDLVGGVQTVTLSDDEAKRKDCRKSVLDRKHAPTFDIIVEIVSFNNIRVHMDTAAAVDMSLSGSNALAINKTLDKDFAVKTETPTPPEVKESKLACWLQGIPTARAEAAIDELELPLVIVPNKTDADLAFVLCKEGERKPKLDIPIYPVTCNTRKSLDCALRKFLVDYCTA